MSKFRVLMVVTGLLFAWLGVPDSASAERRVALVIGNSAYQHVPELANPKNDAAAMVAKLQGMGFEVVSGIDLDLERLRQTVRDFAGRLEGADMALFFYAGHGLQVNGENYLVPVNASLASVIDLDFETVPVNLVMPAMERSAKVNLVFLDACRDNPLADNLARSMGTRSGAVGRGLAKIGSGVGSLIAYATQPGNVALDGKGKNSPFTTALLKHLGTPGMDISRELVLVRRSVLDETGGKQVPWDNSSLTGEVILVSAPEAQPAIAEPAPSASGNATAAIDPVEMAYWDAIKDSDKQLLFETYIQQYPEGAFAPLARAKLAVLQNETQQEASGQSKVQAAEPQKVASVDPSQGEAPAQDSVPMDQAALARDVQTELARVGCLSEKPDGEWGRSSERALKDFAARQGMKLASLDPDPRILERLRETVDRICPLICGKGQEEKNGRCVAVKKEPPADKKPKDAAKPGDPKKAAQGNCPSSATSAANQAWPPRMSLGHTFSGMHPCGRQLRCQNFQSYRLRQCSWE